MQFQPTELSEEGRASIVARTAALPNVQRPFALRLETAAVEVAEWPCDAVVACNVLHVAPVECVRLLAQTAARAGATRVAIYGAFKRHGSHTTFSNANFDAMLRKSNASWGVRDLESEVAPAFAEAGGFQLREVREMPANNFVVLFVRQASTTAPG